MPVSVARTNLSGTTQAAICTLVSGARVVIKNLTAGVPVLIGPTGVTADNGHRIDGNEKLEFINDTSVQQIFGIVGVAGRTAQVSVFQSVVGP